MLGTRAIGTYVMGLIFWANVAPICAVKMPFPTRIVLYRCALLNEVIAVTAMSFGSQGVDRYCPAAVLLCARALWAAAAGRVHAEREATRRLAGRQATLNEQLRPSTVDVFIVAFYYYSRHARRRSSSLRAPCSRAPD